MKIEYKRNGLLGSIPIANKEREKSWNKFIRMKQAKDLFGNDFPLDHNLYLMFCLGWQEGWNDGFIKSEEAPY